MTEEARCRRDHNYQGDGHCPVCLSEEFYTPLIAINRCDICGSQAYVRVTVLVPDKSRDCELLFCSHHYNIHQPALIYNGAKVRQDQRDQLVWEESHA
jgi:hypothetical protein